MLYNLQFQCGVYWTVNLCKPGLNKKPSGGKGDMGDMGDMVGHRFLHVDIDPPKDGTPWSIPGAAEQLTALRYPPSFTIATGGGLGAFWRLDETVQNKHVVTEANRGLAQRLNGDHCHNHDRIMRLPGTVNWPDAKKIARGRQPALSVMFEPDDGVVYPLRALAAEWPAPISDERGGERGHVAPTDFELLTADELGLSLFDSLRSLIDHPAGIDRSKDVLRCAGAMHRAGRTEAEIMGVLMNPENAVSEHIHAQPDPRYQAARVLDRGSESLALRRQEQREANVEIGDASNGLPTAEICRLDQMLDRFVFIRDGSQVAPIDRPQAVMALADFRNTMAASKHPVEDGNGKVKMLPTTKLWLENTQRKETDALTFRAGAPVITHEPDNHLDQYSAILALTHNRVAAFGLQTLINKGVQFERDYGLITGGPSTYQSYQTLLQKDPQMAQQAMHAQWQNLLAIIGYDILPRMIPFMIKFADGLNMISTWMAKHPIASSSLVIGLGILGVGLDIAGKALMALGILRFLGLLGTAATAAEGAAGVGGIAGLAAMLGTGGALVLACGAAALAVGGLIGAIKFLNGDFDAPQNTGADIGGGRGRGLVARHWVVDGSGRTGYNGHWEGIQSGHFNSHWGPHGEAITAKYRVDPNIFKAAPTVNVTVNNKLDAKGLTTAVAAQMAKSASRPNTGPSGFNPAMHPLRTRIP